MCNLVIGVCTRARLSVIDIHSSQYAVPWTFGSTGTNRLRVSNPLLLVGSSTPVAGFPPKAVVLGGGTRSTYLEEKSRVGSTLTPLASGWTRCSGIVKWASLSRGLGVHWTIVARRAPAAMRRSFVLIPGFGSVEFSVTHGGRLWRRRLILEIVSSHAWTLSSCLMATNGRLDSPSWTVSGWTFGAGLLP